MISARLRLCVLLLLAFLSQSGESQAIAQSRAGSDKPAMSIEEAAPCTGLDVETCCAEQLETAGFRALGDQVPRLVKGLIRLACRGERRVMAPQACRSIAVLRGFRSHEVDAICSPSREHCSTKRACNECSTELEKLGYQGAQHVCRSLTYTAPHGSSAIRR